MKIRSRFIIVLSCLLITAMFVSCSNKNNTNDNNGKTDNKELDNTEIEPVVKEPVPETVCYTANESGSISVIDLKTNKVVDTIKTNGVTHNVQVSHDGKILAATIAAPLDGNNQSGGMSMNGKVLSYDTGTNELINETEVGKHPAHVDFTRSGKYAVVANNEDNTVSVIDMSNYKVAKTIETGKGPHGLRIMRDDTLVFVANMGEDSASIISLVNLSLLNTRPLGKSPVQIAIAPDDRTVLATLSGEDALAIYNISSGEINKVGVGKGPVQVFIQTDGKYAFVANQGTKESPSNTVSKVNMETQTVEATIEVGKGAHGVVVSNDNKFVYVTNMYDATVSVIDNAANKVIATIPVEKEPNGITIK